MVGPHSKSVLGVTRASCRFGSTYTPLIASGCLVISASGGNIITFSHLAFGRI